MNTSKNKKKTTPYQSDIHKHTLKPKKSLNRSLLSSLQSNNSKRDFMEDGSMVDNQKNSMQKLSQIYGGLTQIQ